MTGHEETGSGAKEVRNDYLWDGSGEPDPEIQKLEALLRNFQHSRPAPVFPEITPARRWMFFPRRLRVLPRLAVVAAAVAVIAAAAFLANRPKPIPSLTGWNVARIAGTPQVGTRTISEKEGTGRLDVGQMLETDVRSRASLRVEEIGEIEVEPATRLRLLRMSSGLNQLALDRGTIHASIWAPPGKFVVDTPSARAVDLGCAYTLQVDDSGAGWLRTTMGWVGFKLNGHESFIPAGAACATRPKIGPGTPYFEDASEAFRTALARFDFEDSAAEQRQEDLGVILAQARVRDALTLWHVLARVEGSQRALVYDRLRKLDPPPPSITREGVMQLDREMLDLWWHELGLGDISIWERSWSPPDSSAK